MCVHTCLRWDSYDLVFVWVLENVSATSFLCTSSAVFLCLWVLNDFVLTTIYSGTQIQEPVWLLVDLTKVIVGEVPFESHLMLMAALLLQNFMVSARWHV